MEKEAEGKNSTQQSTNNFSLKNNSSLTQTSIYSEDVSIDELHDDLEKRLREQGFIFDKKKFIFQDQHMTFGERIADRVARFGGSWTFIILFGGIIVGWIGVNAFWATHQAFDPFPFILLNLCLSCLAALQAPIIMMSQNRHAAKEQHQQEINLEKDIVDFKQDRLDLILDQKQWQLLKKMDERIKNIETAVGAKKSIKKAKLKTKSKRK